MNAGQGNENLGYPHRHEGDEPVEINLLEIQDRSEELLKKLQEENSPVVSGEENFDYDIEVPSSTISGELDYINGIEHSSCAIDADGGQITISTFEYDEQKVAGDFFPGSEYYLLKNFADGNKFAFRLLTGKNRAGGDVYFLRFIEFNAGFHETHLSIFSETPQVKLKKSDAENISKIFNLFSKLYDPFSDLDLTEIFNEIDEEFKSGKKIEEKKEEVRVLFNLHKIECAFEDIIEIRDGNDFISEEIRKGFLTFLRLPKDEDRQAFVESRYVYSRDKKFKKAAIFNVLMIENEGNLKNIPTQLIELYETDSKNNIHTLSLLKLENRNGEEFYYFMHKVFTTKSETKIVNEKESNVVKISITQKQLKEMMKLFPFLQTT